MSIKKLFGSTKKDRNYLADTNQKEAFQDVESSRNATQIKIKQDSYLPQIDYKDPANFAKYGSAYLYYKGAIERVLDYYPYDGSGAEINKFYNESLDIEKYIFDNLYPRTAGYIIVSADGWGTRTGSKVNGYGLPATLEYIDFVGGPNTSSYAGLLANAFDNPQDSKFQSSNIYDTSIYQTDGLPSDYGVGTRESNLKSNFDTGVTVEFWLQTGSLDTSSTTDKQVIFDMWNNEATGSSTDYGRITILLDSAVAKPLTFVVESGSVSKTSTIGSDAAATASFGDWQHYALSFYNSGSSFVTKLYVNGVLNDTVTSATTVSELKAKNMQGRLGALITSPSGSAAPAGAGKLSGSVDEFRFWKESRNAQDIGRYWFTQVRGGVNTDISNTTLGLYYKFNEGIVEDSSVDSVVLDYSGRLGNGIWTGYGSNSRNTGSAILEASASTKEYLDPIIYADHSNVSTLKTDLLNSGSYHDSNNNNSFLSLMPSWIIEGDDTDTSHLRKLTHIAGAYFDKLFLQISSLPSFKGLNYTSPSQKPIPFAEHFPQSLGLYTPDIFIDSKVMEQFLNRDEDSLFESDLEETKQLIYLNLYNNLTNIYKNKGTEKSIRNIFRCFNINDKLVRLNVYSNNQTYELKNNLQQTQIKKTVINQNKTDNLGGTILQFYDSGSAAESQSYISGSSVDGLAGFGTYPEDKYGFTAEADIVFPYYSVAEDTITRDYTDVSLFGVYQFDGPSISGTQATASAATSSYDLTNFQVYAVKTSNDSKNVHFKLTSSNAPYPFPILTSSIFFGVYDNTRWNISVRVKPSNYPYADVITGSSAYTYDVVFRGTHEEMGVIRDSFVVTGSMTKTIGTGSVRAHKRMYVGARRENMTGTVLQKSDVLLNNCRFWLKYLEDGDLNQHTYDINNVGISGSYRNISPLDSNSDGYNLLNSNTNALNWTFEKVTGSDASGEFAVTDMSSGSAELRNNYGWLGTIGGYQHTGRGFGYTASSTDVIEKETINAYKFIDPEIPVASDMVQILSNDDKVYGITQTVPTFFYTIEKSIYNAISEEMLIFLAGVIDFNNVIGEPVNRYRTRYKALEKLRETFFRKVTTVSEVEKYVDYYRWLDDSISLILEQILPASAEYVADVYNTIESHVLERNKYQSQFPSIENKSSTEAPMIGINALTYDWKFNHHPVGNTQDENSQWWQQRAERSGSTVISSGDNSIDDERDTLRNTIGLDNKRSFPAYRTTARTPYYGISFIKDKLSKPYKLETKRTLVYKGGINFLETKNLAFTLNAVRPAGPINEESGAYVPMNVLMGDIDDLVGAPNTSDVKEPWNKTKRIIKVQHGRDWEEGIGYKNVKSSYAFPFSILSSSTDAAVKTGYGKTVTDLLQSDLEIVNLHQDAYGPDLEVPMQGPFTNYAVGKGSLHGNL